MTLRHLQEIFRAFIILLGASFFGVNAFFIKEDPHFILRGISIFMVGIFLGAFFEVLFKFFQGNNEDSLEDPLDSCPEPLLLPCILEQLTEEDKQNLCQELLSRMEEEKVRKVRTSVIMRTTKSL